MVVRNMKEFKVEEKYMCDLSYIKDFEALSKKYKMGCEFELVGGLDFKVVKETPTIYCYNHKVAIYPKNNEICEAHILTSVNFEKRLLDANVPMVSFEEELVEGSIRTCHQRGVSGEFVIHLYIKDIDKVVDIFKIRKANVSGINPHSLRNLHDYLRFARNIDSQYGNILEHRIMSNRDEENEGEN